MRDSDNPRAVGVDLACGARFDAYRPPDGVTAQYLPEDQIGIFAWFPISKIVVIKDPKNGRHEDKLKELEGSGVPIVLEDE